MDNVSQQLVFPQTLQHYGPLLHRCATKAANELIQKLNKPYQKHHLNNWGVNIVETKTFNSELANSVI